MKKRPPIVTVLGHVDHGKTTLLDTIRKTRVADSEAGGITQGIGASLINTKQGEITFIDTPGHEAFSQMRKRGVSLSDIAVLMVAADDGPMPQTKEALQYIQDNDIPFIVAFSKMDLPSANFEKAIADMEKIGVYFEKRGGQTPFVQMSSKTGEGIDDLLEMIILVAEVNEVQGDPENELLAHVIETNKDKRGLIVTAVVKDGSIQRGKSYFCEQQEVKIKGLFSDTGDSIQRAKPGEPVAIMGFADMPRVGSVISSTPPEKSDSSPAQSKTNQNKNAAGDFYKSNKEHVAVILKVKSAGSLDAIKNSLPQEVTVIDASVGDVTETDVFMAKSSRAKIYAFETGASASVEKLAESEDVGLYKFDIIYELIRSVEEVVSSNKEHITGRLEILAVFPYNKMNVAGGKVLEGEMKLNDKVKVMRGKKVLGVSKISSLRSGKKEINTAKAGQECGVLIKPQLEFSEGDLVLSVQE